MTTPPRTSEMSPRDRAPVRTSSSRHPSGKTPGTSGPLTLWLAAVGTNYWFVWPEGNWPPDWAWFLPRFFSILSPMEFSFLAAVASGLLSWGHSFPAQSSTWLHRYYLNWTKLDNATTKFNDEMHSADNWVLNPVILHYWQNLPILILCSACYNLYC